MPFEAPNGWTIELVDQGVVGRLITFEWSAWPTLAAHLANEVPFVRMNHRAQLREAHQRIVRGPSDGLMHQGSGSTFEVKREDLDAFVESDSRFVEYVDGDSKKLDDWERLDDSVKVAPFIFPSFEGVDQALDPQWQRELHMVTIDSQITDAILRKVADLEVSGRRGDLRGTTLNLQVGASGDDGQFSLLTGTGSEFDATVARSRVGFRNGSTQQQEGNWDRFPGIGGLGLAKATIHSATISVWGDNTDVGTPLTELFLTDVAAPAAPTNLTEAQALESTITTAVVTWDSPGLSLTAFTESPSLVSMFQEVVDSHDPSAFQIMWLDDGSPPTFNHIAAASYDRDTAEAVKLDIEFTRRLRLYGERQRWA